MLEAQVLYYLNRYLGAYVKGLDPEALRISVFKGDLELRNLQLKPEALQKLKLPITVKAGLLGSLKLKVGPPELTQAVSCIPYAKYPCVWGLCWQGQCPTS